MSYKLKESVQIYLLVSIHPAILLAENEDPKCVNWWTFKSTSVSG